jgi:hypothetical protein
VKDSASSSHCAPVQSFQLWLLPNTATHPGARDIFRESTSSRLIPGCYSSHLSISSSVPLGFRSFLIGFESSVVVKMSLQGGYACFVFCSCRVCVFFPFIFFFSSSFAFSLLFKQGLRANSAGHSSRQRTLTRSVTSV